MPEVLALLIPIVALLIPIVVVLTRHQQKMAEILHGSRLQEDDRIELGTLRQEIAELKRLVLDQTIALDSLSGALPPRSQKTSPPEVRDRLSDVV
jgi:hypothetical protein